MGTRTFTDLEVYQISRRLRIKVAVLTERDFPGHEKYKLSDQIIRSSRRVTACIAEGYGRYYFKENIRFCRMARGSLLETLEHLITAFDSHYISAESLKEFKSEIDSCARLINGYINYLKKNQAPKEED
jgi:four helix bundle protein